MAEHVANRVAGRRPALVDSHAHLTASAYNLDRKQVVQRAAAAGVVVIVDVGYDLRSSLRAMRFAISPGSLDPLRSEERAGGGEETRAGEPSPEPAAVRVVATAGIHPHDAAEAQPGDYARIEELAREPAVVAIGEIGLDYYRDLSPRDVQRGAFEQQLAAAARVGKPVSIHCREAHAETLSILKAGLPGAGKGQGRGVMHCYSGSPEMAEEFLKLGLFISLAGPVTYGNARRPQEVARVVPLDRLLVETDCPYLTPVPFRGKRNEPAFVAHVALAIAQARRDDPDLVFEATSRNACSLFGL